MIVDLTKNLSGFCDRLRQVTWCVAAARLRGERELFFKEILTRPCPFSFMDVCEADGFEIRPWAESMGAAEVVMDSTNGRSLHTVRRYKPAHFNVTDEKFLDLWGEAYQRLRPKPALQERIDALGVGPDCLAVHLRYTDRVSPDYNPHKVYPGDIESIENALLRLVAERAEREGISKVLITSDQEAGKIRCVRKFREAGYRVVVHDAKFDPAAFRQTSGDDFVVELFALARCRAIVGTVPSNVVRTANLIAGRREVLFAVDHTLKRRLLRPLYTTTAILIWRYWRKFKKSVGTLGRPLLHSGPAR